MTDNDAFEAGCDAYWDGIAREDTGCIGALELA
jgi:hypothetical protein